MGRTLARLPHCFPAGLSLLDRPTTVNSLCFLLLLPSAVCLPALPPLLPCSTFACPRCCMEPNDSERLDMTVTDWNGAREHPAARHGCSIVWLSGLGNLGAHFAHELPHGTTGCRGVTAERLSHHKACAPLGAQESFTFALLPAASCYWFVIDSLPAAKYDSLLERLARSSAPHRLGP